MGQAQPPTRSYLIIFNVDVMKTWAGFASLFLGFSFIFGNSIRTTVSGRGAAGRRKPNRPALRSGVWCCTSRCHSFSHASCLYIFPFCCAQYESVIFMFLAHPYDVGDALWPDK